jgi:DNA ligase D-like protein (predicted 3'-phosphoesterase)
MSDAKEKLADYREKRDFGKTPEPGDRGIDFDWAGERPIFVIQKHAASTLHYDFRIEVDGVLKSWAVPKGPSTDPKQKRLAIPTEDHPLEYAEFEGVIPADAYGGGTVLIWDWGSYRNLKEDEIGEQEARSISRQIEDGHVAIWLNGQKLSGGYALIRTGRGEDARWLLIKINDDKADAQRNPTSTETRSVKSGRTLEEIEHRTGKDENNK